MNRRVIAFGTAALWAVNTAIAQHQANVLPFQGQLANQTGQPLSPAAPSTLVFRLYRQAVGGVAIWEESQPGVAVEAGRFSVLLGSRTELPAAPNFNATLYLGITVDDGNPATADVEMRPRQALVPVLSASWAKNAAMLDGYDWSAVFESNDPGGPIPASKLADGSLPGDKLADASVAGAKLQPGTISSNHIAAQSLNASLITAGTITSNQLATGAIDLSSLAQQVAEALNPPGTIVAFGGHWDRMPAGWILCDGRELPIATHERLFNAIRFGWGGDANAGTFRVPDLRGLFLRGVDYSPVTLESNPARDPDRGDYGRSPIHPGGNPGNQVGSLQGDETRSHSHDSNARWAPLPGGGSDAYGFYIHAAITRSDPNWFSLRSTGGNETRPKNAYVNYIIKY